MKEMNEELISAYLDDELSPQEREDVERALTQNAALRQLRTSFRRYETTLIHYRSIIIVTWSW